VSLTPTPAITLQSQRLAYPGMLPREILIWQTWLAQWEASYDSFQYNARVGPGFDPGPGWPDNMRTMAIANSQKRIDAVAWQGSQPTLIEVKDRAGAAALGQLLTYLPLWMQTYPDLPRPLLAIVTNRIQPGIDTSCAFHSITLYITPTDFSQLRTGRRASPFMAKQSNTNTYTPS
jgi:hypothetical protein